mmetsp:Transcript_51649/g.167759  ORF Transcript_51649/g.167759 Transcript_51649/m.167759 type:complete len:182 (-) Transcript_51649:857-1402(-)
MFFCGPQQVLPLGLLWGLGGLRSDPAPRSLKLSEPCGLVKLIDPAPVMLYPDQSGGLLAGCGELLVLIGLHAASELCFTFCGLRGDGELPGDFGEPLLVTGLSDWSTVCCDFGGLPRAAKLAGDLGSRALRSTLREPPPCTGKPSGPYFDFGLLSPGPDMPHRSPLFFFVLTSFKDRGGSG